MCIGCEWNILEGKDKRSFLYKVGNKHFWHYFFAYRLLTLYKFVTCKFDNISLLYIVYYIYRYFLTFNDADGVFNLLDFYDIYNMIYFTASLVIRNNTFHFILYISRSDRVRKFTAVAKQVYPIAKRLNIWIDVYKRQVCGWTVIALDSVYDIRSFIFGCRVFEAWEERSNSMLVFEC